MRAEINIQIGQEFNPAGTSARFYRKCVDWARKLNEVTHGGVSVKFWGPPVMISPIASVWWNGKEVIELFLERDGTIRKLVSGNSPELNPVVTDENIGDKMRQGLCAVISEEIEKMTGLRARFSAMKWDKISLPS